jgi:hypothetical protein
MTKQDLRVHIAELLAAYLFAEDHKLPYMESDMIINSLADFVDDSMMKYIRGSKEHGGDFINGCNHNKEIYQEVIDTFWYNRAQKQQLKECDENTDAVSTRESIR